MKYVSIEVKVQALQSAKKIHQLLRTLKCVFVCVSLLNLNHSAVCLSPDSRK